MTRRASTAQRGMLSTELAILMPVMFAIALLAVFVVHVERHGSRAQQAADAAARAASLTRGETDALAAAQSAAEAVCRGSVVLDSGSWEYQAPEIDTFTPGRVTVGVACSEGFTGFSLLTEDQVRVEIATAVSAIEYWRADS